MFNFLGKNDYSSKCTKILNKETGLDPLIAQAFIEDFKPIFDEEYSKNNNPEETLINSGMIVLQHVLEESINCLLYTSPSPRDATLSRMPSSA